MRQVIRSEGCRDGWSVMNRRERVQIQRRWVGPGNTRHKKGISTHQRSGINWEAAVEKWRADKLSQG